MITEEEVTFLLRRAGETMRRMPGGSVSLDLSRIALDSVDDPRMAYGYSPVELNRIPPSSRDISLMDIVFPWLSYIPDTKIVFRKIVAHRMLWDSERGRSIWSYRRLGKKLGCSHVSVKVWEEEAIYMITTTVNKQNGLEHKISLYMRGLTGAYLGQDEVLSLRDST